MSFFQEDRLRYSASDNPLKPNRLRFFLLDEENPQDRLDFEFNPTQITDPQEVEVTVATDYASKEMKTYAQVEKIKSREIAVSLFMNEIGSNHLHPQKSLSGQIQWLLDKMNPKKNSNSGLSQEAHVLLVGIPLISKSGFASRLLRATLTKVVPTYTMWGQDGWPLRATVEIVLSEYFAPAV